MLNAECRMQNAEFRVQNAYTACGILPSEEMILSDSTESVIPAYISPSGKLCFKSWSRVQSSKFKVQSSKFEGEAAVAVPRLFFYAKASGCFFWISDIADLSPTTVRVP